MIDVDELSQVEPVAVSRPSVSSIGGLERTD